MGLKTAMSEWLVQCLTRNEVVAGPFTGMKYPGKSVGSAYCPKLLGTYELELAEVIDQLIAPPRLHH
jgi:hypothetical protein